VPRRFLVGGALFVRFACEGVVEVVGDRLFDLIALGHDPHDQKERHHGGDEVGVSHFPRTAAFASHGKYS
jgi:hypothetical protein